MTKTNLEIEEEFVKWCNEDPALELANGVGSFKNIADWWFYKLQQRMDEIEKSLPLYRSGVLEQGETQDFRDGRNAGLKEVREVLNIIKSVDKNNGIPSL